MIERIIISLGVVTVFVHFYKKSGNFWKSIVNTGKVLTPVLRRPFRKPDDQNLNHDLDKKQSLLNLVKTMRFSKSDNIYIITGITGLIDADQNQILNFCYLGVCFDDENNTKNTIEIIDVHSPKIDNTKGQTSHEELLKQVRNGLSFFNQSFETNYTLSKIYYNPDLNRSDLIYRRLICLLVRHYHEGNKFKEY